MAGVMGEDAQLMKESSWTVCHGSLESCITVIFVDPDSQEPIVPSSSATGRLVLVPPEGSVPCEITIKFQGRQCNVQSLYILSTACTYELYSQTDHMIDPEYVCTVKGWIPDREDEASCSSEGVKMTSSNHLANSVQEDLENDNILDEATKHRYAKLDSGGDLSCKVEEENFGSASQIIFNDNSLLDMVTSKIIDQTVMHDSVGQENEDLDRSIYSSGDSWVDVKFSHSSSEHPFEGSIPPQPFYQQIDGIHQREACLDSHLLKNQPMLEVNDVQTMYAEVNCDSLPRRGCCVPTPSEEAKFESRESSRSSFVQQNMYEAELELVDHSPWTSLTIRLLSLQDRFCVEVDQMVLLVVPGPPVPNASSSTQSLGGGANSALLAMLIPSMLQMVQGVPNQRLKDASIGVLLNSNGSSKTIRPTVDVATTEKDENDIISPDENSVAYTEVTVEGRQGLSASVDSMNNENITKHNAACFTSGKESISSSVESFERPVQPTVTFLSGREAAIVNSDKSVKQPLQPPSIVQSACEAGYACPYSCEHDKGSDASSLSLKLDTFLERFDKLEVLCMRMESYIVKTVEKLDQRLTLLEREHSKLPEYTSLEPRHVTSKEPCPFLSTPSLSVSPIPTGTGCLAAEEVDFTESPALIETTIDEKSQTQETAVEAALLDSSDIHTAKGGSLGVVDVLSKVLELEVPVSPHDLESSPSTMSGMQGYPEKKPQISLDDAWDSALCAFSSSCIPADVSVFTPFVHVDSKVLQEISCVTEDSQSCGSQSDVKTPMPCTDLDCAPSREAQDLTEETPVTSFSGIEKQMDRSCLVFCGTLHPLSEADKSDLFLCKEEISQSGFHNHTVDIGLDQVNHNEGGQKLPLQNHWNSEKDETFVIDLHGHDASDIPFGGILQLTENDNCRSLCSREKSGEISNDHAIFDLLSCCESSIHTEQKNFLSGIETLISDMEGLYFKKVQNANLDAVHPEFLSGCSSGLNRLVDVECKEEGFPSCEIALNNILGDDNLNDIDDTSCSENSTCISQEFDIFRDHFSVCEWSSTQNLCLVQDPAMTDPDISNQGVDLEEIFLMESNDSNSFSKHLKEGHLQPSFFEFSLSKAHLLDVDQAPQQQLTGDTIFPGFEGFL